MAFTGSATLIGRQGEEWSVWLQSGEIHASQYNDFVVLPAPTDGHAWLQVELASLSAASQGDAPAEQRALPVEGR